jgi:hypothetical protein
MGCGRPPTRQGQDQPASTPSKHVKNDIRTSSESSFLACFRLLPCPRLLQERNGAFPVWVSAPLRSTTVVRSTEPSSLWRKLGSRHPKIPRFNVTLQWARQPQRDRLMSEHSRAPILPCCFYRRRSWCSAVNSHHERSPVRCADHTRRDWLHSDAPLDCRRLRGPYPYRRCDQRSTNQSPYKSQTLSPIPRALPICRHPDPFAAQVVDASGGFWIRLGDHAPRNGSAAHYFPPAR